MAEGSDVPPGLPEETVLVIQEDQVNLVIGCGHGLFVSDSPEVGLEVVVEVVHFLHFFGYPFAEAFVAWSLINVTHSVKALVAAKPEVLQVEVHASNFLVDVSLVLGLGLRFLRGHLNDFFSWLASWGRFLFS